MRVFRTWHDDVRPFNDPVSVLGAGFCPARVVKSHRHASFLNDPLLSASMVDPLSLTLGQYLFMLGFLKISPHG